MSVRPLAPFYKRPRVRLALAGTFVAVMVSLGIGLTVSGALTPEDVRAEVASYGAFSAVVFVLVFVLGNLLHMPALVFITAGAVAFGVVPAALLSILAGSIGAVLNLLYLRRLSGGSSMRRLDQAWVGRILDGIESRPFLTVLLLRLVFNTSPALSAALAFTGVPFWPYTLASVLGMSPVVIIVTFGVDAALF